MFTASLSSATLGSVCAVWSLVRGVASDRAGRLGRVERLGRVGRVLQVWAAGTEEGGWAGEERAGEGKGKDWIGRGNRRRGLIDD